MGFSIGSFLGAIAPIVGSVFGGPVGAAIGGAVGAGFARAPEAQALPGRQTQPVNGQRQGLTSIVPVPANIPRISFAPSRRFAGGGGTRTLVGGVTGAVARAAGGLFGTGVGAGLVISEILERARANSGQRVTKNKIIDAAKACGIELAADSFGLSETDVCKVIVAGRSRRRRGVSAADVRRTKRTLRFVKSIKKDLKAVRL